MRFFWQVKLNGSLQVPTIPVYVCMCSTYREGTGAKKFLQCSTDSEYLYKKIIKKKKKKKKKGNLKIYIVVSSILLNYLFLLYDEVMIMGKV
jgi:hypothetical protein